MNFWCLVVYRKEKAMKKIVLIALFAAFALSATAQTKRIAYRSHSGSNAMLALLEDDNLGLNPEIERRWVHERLVKDSLLKVDSAANNQLKKDSVKSKQKQPRKHIPNDTLQTKPKPQKIDNKKGEVIDSGKTEERQGGFPALLLVGLLIPTGFAAAFALRQ